MVFNQKSFFLAKNKRQKSLKFNDLETNITAHTTIAAFFSSFSPTASKHSDHIKSERKIFVPRDYQCVANRHQLNCVCVRYISSWLALSFTNGFFSVTVKVNSINFWSEELPQHCLELHQAPSTKFTLGHKSTRHSI